MDIEEAEYKDQQRKEAVVKAKTQLYYQTDQVKGLHVSMAYSFLIVIGCILILWDNNRF